jgi:mono/diheme cytochrome c family protein
MAFAGKTLALQEYRGRPTGIPADFQEVPREARGKYLTDAADCQACHTAPGGKPFAGGRAFDTQFGTMYSPNITPDMRTGIGNYTDADFLKALHEGVGKGGLRLYPAFPYAAYTYLTDEDVLAIKAYLFSLPAEQNEAPKNELKFPFNQRWLMFFWSTLYNPDTRFRPVADRTATWNRGAYLVEALGHCGDCHTPRTPLQSLNNRRKFAGGSAEGWRAYNVSSDRDSGIGTWSAGDLESYLKTGHSDDRGSAFGPMAEAVHLSLAKLTASDVTAIVDYLRSVPAVSTPDLPASKSEPAPKDPLRGIAKEADAQGAMLFAGDCAGCHGWTGVNRDVPHTMLTGTRAVNDPSATNVALAVLRGAATLPPSGDIATMPAFGAVYSDRAVAVVANFVIARFGVQPSAITPEEVRKLRETR